MADDSFNDGRASEEPYTRIRTLGRGAFGEAVLYRKTEVSYPLKLTSTAARETHNVGLLKIRQLNKLTILIFVVVISSTLYCSCKSRFDCYKL